MGRQRAESFLNGLCTATARVRVVADFLDDTCSSRKSATTRTRAVAVHKPLRKLSARCRPIHQSFSTDFTGSGLTPQDGTNLGRGPGGRALEEIARWSAAGGSTGNDATG